MATFPRLGDLSGSLFQPIPSPTPSKLIGSTGRPKVMITSVKIPDEHIFANGLFQNVYIVYCMLEAMGYEPWMLVENNKNHVDAKVHKKYRMLDFPEYVAKPFGIVAYIEMAMSCDPSIRKFFRSIGAKTVKVYLGNILNIDIETITFYRGMNFSHHIAGELDEIWVSPHYDFHTDYASSVNNILGKTRIAPYVWDPMFIEETGTKYNSENVPSQRPFLIMEPNISFQKCSLIPIMIVEAFQRRSPSLVGEIIVINGAKLLENTYFKENVLPYLEVAKVGKLKLVPRANVVNLMKAVPHAIVVQHQWNNEYNYSFLEFMHMGYPVIHNVKRFQEYGYYYEGGNFEQGADKIQTVIKDHDANKYSYASQIKQLTWRFSIHNPDNQKSWNEMLGSKSTNLIAKPQ